MHSVMGSAVRPSTMTGISLSIMLASQYGHLFGVRCKIKMLTILSMAKSSSPSSANSTTSDRIELC
jgi:hypothetical protein